MKYEMHNESNFCGEVPDENDFREATDEERQEFEHLIKYVLKKFRSEHHEQEVKKILEGAYKVSVKQGSHLTNSRTTAYISAMTHDAKEKATGTAELIPLSGVGSKIKIDLAVDRFFEAASYFTGQHYLSQINKRLCGLEEKVDRILEYLDTDRAAEFSATMSSIHDLISLVEFVEPGSLEAMNYIQDLRRIQFLINKRIFIIEKKITDSLQAINRKDDTHVFENKIESVIQLVDEYQKCILVLFEAIVNAILLEGLATDPRKISVYISSMEDKKNKYLYCVDCIIKVAEGYISNGKLYDKADEWQLATIEAANFANIVSGLAALLNHRSTPMPITNINSLNQSTYFLHSEVNAKHINIQKKVERLKEKCLNTTAFDEIIESAWYISAEARFIQEQAFIVNGEKILTNCPPKPETNVMT